MGDDRPASGTTRRRVLAGVAGLGVSAVAAKAGATRRDPVLGPNVLIVDPGKLDAQRRIDRLFAQQERAHFTDRGAVSLTRTALHTMRIGL